MLWCQGHSSSKSFVPIKAYMRLLLLNNTKLCPILHCFRVITAHWFKLSLFTGGVCNFPSGVKWIPVPWTAKFGLKRLDVTLSSDAQNASYTEILEAGLSCNFHLIKKSFYRAFNAIYGKVGRLASVDVVPELFKIKCMSILLLWSRCLSNKSQPA